MSHNITIFCHGCHNECTVRGGAMWDGSCPYCGSDFVEEITRPRRTVRIQRQEGGGPSAAGRGRGNTAAARGGGGDSGGGDSQAAMRVLSDMIGAYVGNARISINMVGGNADVVGGGGRGGGGGGGSEQDWLDQLMSRLMDEYQPRSIPTAFRISAQLPMYDVRAKGAEGEPAANEAFACAGEPCSICHDEFAEGARVVELPCSHCFHSGCLKPWLETHNTCPICRIELPQDSEDEDDDY